MSWRVSFSRPLVCIYFYVLLPHCSIIDFRDESRFDHSKDWISIVLCSWSGFPSELIKGLPTYFTFFVVEHCEGAVSLPWLLIFYAGTFLLPPPRTLVLDLSGHSGTHRAGTFVRHKRNFSGRFFGFVFALRVSFEMTAVGKSLGQFLEISPHQWLLL